MSKQNVTVHAYMYQQVFCGFSREVPGNWPEGHKWVKPTEIDKITCELCKARAKHLKLKESIPQDFVRELDLAPDPETATNLVLTKSVDEACAAIDKMNVIAASLVLGILFIKHKGESKADEIHAKALYLGIRGSEGPAAARDQYFHETGVFIA